MTIIDRNVIVHVFLCILSDFGPVKLFLCILTLYPDISYDIACRVSPFPKLLTQSSCSVVKLTDRKIRWIIREKSKDVLCTADIARLQNVSESRVRQLLSEYRKTGYIHILNKPGRPLRNVSCFEVSAGYQFLDSIHAMH